MLTCGHLQILAQARLAEALALLAGGHYNGAYYLAGYAAELGLKALIAGKFVGNEIPDRDFVNSVYTHDLEKLVEKAGLKPDLDQRRRMDARFQANWEIVKDWDESSRYEIKDGAEARGLVDALSDEIQGVFPWIRAHW